MMAKETKNQAESEIDLAKKIENSTSSKTVVSTTLKTDQRVIARVTDGIYRQPASAVRELISNSYDADATRVVIKTDAPRFERISIEDNGKGMSPQVLAHMLLHIGGSAKRHEVGQDLGVTNANDPSRSPGGRKLIGKIGIGIFSVAQLTHTFQIITKTRGDNFRTIATVVLKQYSDEGFSEEDNKDEYESGKVNVWREKAIDIESHGTTIILTNIRPQAKNTLRSREIWSAIEQSESTSTGDEQQTLEPPKYHIGRVDSSGDLLSETAGKLNNIPWDEIDSPEEAFEKLVNTVWEELKYSNPNPKLERIFDYYLQMVWSISLSIPLPYVNEHLFDLNLNGWALGYLISNTTKGAATNLPTEGDKSLRHLLDLVEGANLTEFDVFFDDLKLSRPIKYQDLPTPSHAIKTPLVFIGKCIEDFNKYPHELSGGPLGFEAYLFWTPKVAPTEHRGSLIRIHGASGTLFDPSFMRYQISEQTRLSQITCEIFVQNGFDSALNIDRESFNYAHPHAVFLTRWLHSALRQLATVQKRVANEIRAQDRMDSKTEQISELSRIALDVWHEETKDKDSIPPSIVIEEHSAQRTLLNEMADISFNRLAIIPKRESRQTGRLKTQEIILDEKLKAIVQVLTSFKLLDYLSKAQQERLLKAIYKILETQEE